jgi:hypothetical protein
MHGPMRDWMADWHKWSPAERALAVGLIVTMALVLPLGFLITAGHAGI